MAIYQIMRGCGGLVAGFGPVIALYGGLRVVVGCRSFEAFGGL